VRILDKKNFEYFSFWRGKKTVQTFDDKGKDKTLAKIIHFDKVTQSVIDHLACLNDRGCGIFMCVNETDGKGRRGSNVIKVRSAYADLDGSPLERALEYSPSLVVESSKGRFHCYWFTNDTPLEAFTAVQKNIIRALGSDPAVHDLPRVLRVPGYFHQKSDPFLTSIHSFSGVVFTYRDLVGFFPPEKVKKFSAKRFRKDTPVIQGDFKGQYGAPNGERNCHVFKRIGGMIKRGHPWDYIEKEAIKEGLACNPPMELQEIERVLRSARRYYV
jgi:hypothetical protein